MANVPEAKPIVLCNDVIADLETDNVHLIGIFNSIRPISNPSYPHMHKEF